MKRAATRVRSKCNMRSRCALRVLALSVFVTSSPVYALAEAAAEHHADAGHEAHPPASIASLFWPLVNFVLYSLLMVYAYRRLARPILRQRAVDLKEHLQKAKTALADADEKLDALKQRLETISCEKDELTERLMNEGKNIVQTVVVAADASVSQIKHETARRIAGETAKAEAEVRAEAILRATKMAKERIVRELSAEDDARLRDEAIRSIGLR